MPPALLNLCLVTLGLFLDGSLAEYGDVGDSYLYSYYDEEEETTAQYPATDLTRVRRDEGPETVKTLNPQELEEVKGVFKELMAGRNIDDVISEKPTLSTILNHEISRYSDQQNRSTSAITRNEYDSISQMTRNEYDSITQMIRNEYDSITQMTRNEYDSITQPRNEYDSITQMIRNEYDSITQITRNEYDSITQMTKTEYDSITQTTRNEYDSITQMTRHEYDSITQMTRNEYDSITQTTRNEYHSITQMTVNEYESVVPTAQNNYDIISPITSFKIGRTGSDNTDATASKTTTAANTTATTNATTTTTTETPTTKFQFDVEKFLEILANLTYEYDTDLVERMNDTLIKHKVLTCGTPTTTDTPSTWRRVDYKELNHTLVAKCFVCGLTDHGVPYNAYCADAFSSEFIPIVRVDARAKTHISQYRKYCRYLDVNHYRTNRTMPRTIFGRWTGGCSVRWTDLTGIYTQRSCRNKYHATTGRHYASKRMAKLEMALKDLDNGCIISPVASLIPLSRGISLFARFHACVCTGNFCNGAKPHFDIDSRLTFSVAALTLFCRSVVDSWLKLK